MFPLFTQSKDCFRTGLFVLSDGHLVRKHYQRTSLNFTGKREEIQDNYVSKALGRKPVVK